MTVPESEPGIDPALFSWTPSGSEFLYDIQYRGVFVTQVLFVGGAHCRTETEADVRTELVERLQELLASMSHHERLAFWARVNGER